jgi:hypothetical protein
MLLAPFPVQPAPRRSGRRTTAPELSGAIAVLAGWLVLGLIACAFVPALQGGRLLGQTAVFWLVAAPLIDLVWLRRARLVGAIGKAARAVHARRRPRGATRVRRAHVDA